MAIVANWVSLKLHLNTIPYDIVQNKNANMHFLVISIYNVFIYTDYFVNNDVRKIRSIMALQTIITSTTRHIAAKYSKIISSSSSLWLL